MARLDCSCVERNTAFHQSRDEGRLVFMIAGDRMKHVAAKWQVPLAPGASLSLGVLGATAGRLLVFLGFLLVAGLMGRLPFNTRHQRFGERAVVPLFVLQ